jgi:HPt (histidine-containing phosphotransfer) domain-containing protein
MLMVLARWVDVPGDGAAPLQAAPAASAEAPLPGELPGISIAAGLRMCNGKPSLYRKMLQQFRETQRGAAEEIAALLMSGDRMAAADAAHSMKTTAGIIGAEGLADLSRSLERALLQAAGDEHQALLLSFEREMKNILGGLDGALSPPDPRGSGDPAMQRMSTNP